jgi:hypothetical protein
MSNDYVIQGLSLCTKIILMFAIMFCLAVGDEAMCAELQTSGEFCDRDQQQNTTVSSDGQHNTLLYLAFCPCAAGLTCGMAVSSSEESDVSAANFQTYGIGMCKAAEPETDEEEQADSFIKLED